PLVAGVCALMLTANPDLTAREVKQILTQTADKIGNPAEYVNGHSRKYGYGMVNAERAVAEAMRRRGTSTPTPMPNPTPTPQPNPTPTPQPVNTGGSSVFEVNVNQMPRSGWGVQIGVYSNYDNVLSLVAKIKQQFGQAVFIVVSNQNGRQLYKVVVGAYANVNEASIMQSRLTQSGYQGFVKNLADV
nr:SPOR domain-containing protein [Haliscomenobacter sp.]